MGKKFEVKMHCRTGKGAFIAVFEEMKPNEWWSMEAKPLPAPQPDKKQSLLQRLGFVKKTEPPKQEPQNKTQIQGAIYIGEMRCPYCGNESFVRCGVCGEYTCLPGEPQKTYKCAACGAEGPIDGVMTDLSGDMGDNQNSDISSLSRVNNNKSGGATLR